MRPGEPSVHRGTRTRQLFLSFAFTCGVAGSALSGAVDWGPPEVVSAGVPRVSSPAGSSVIWQSDAWHVVCEKDGGVQYHWRDAEGWHAGPDLAPAGTFARDPHLAVCGDELMAVWSAPSMQERGVFARRGIFTAWNSAEALSGGDLRSQAPVVSGFSDQRALAVWEDSTGAGFRIRGRVFDSQGWGPIEEVSLGSADAREPTLLADPCGFSYYTNWTVAWTDWRHGTPAIYRRNRGLTWEDEVRLTHLTQDCRHPSALLARGGDFPFPYPVVTFEAAGPLGGAQETWIARDVQGGQLVSDDDGIASIGANLSGFYTPFTVCGLMPFSSTFTRITWRDQPSSGAVLRSAWTGSVPSAPDSLSTSLPAGAALATLGLGADASLIQVWTDQVGGRPTLLARIGSTAGCFSAAVVAPSALVLGPAGDPPTRLRHVDLCSGEGLPGGWVELGLGELIDQVTLDAGQPAWLSGEFGEEGWIEFRIRGGGCAASGTSYASGGFNCETQLTGARSPDVDGDCAVTPADRAYVVAHVGTSDFCSDLDDDGVVSEADLAIVDATMGDVCGATSGVDALPPPAPLTVAGGLQLRAWPNPARAVVRLAIQDDSATRDPSLGERGSVRLWACDASGREVSRIDASPLGDGWTADWDLRDRDGRRVPAGCYFVRLSANGEERRVPVLVIR